MLGMRALILAPLLILTACQQTPFAVIEHSAAIEEGERLLAVPPPGWKRIYTLNERATRLVDFIKETESAKDWTTKLSFESFAARDIEADPITLLMTEAQSDMSKCNFVQHFNVFSGVENNYETSVRLFLCGENAFSGMGEVKLVKVIRGIAYYYSIRITKKIEPFEVHQPAFTEAQIANWSNYLRTISACDDTPAHPCPGKGTEQTDTD